MPWSSLCRSDIAKTQDGKLRGFSDSKIVRGIMTILLEKQATLSDNMVGRFDFIEYLINLGLHTFFSEGRRDGIAHMIQKIKHLRVN
jgi:sulfur transfer protein SufE